MNITATGLTKAAGRRSRGRRVRSSSPSRSTTRRPTPFTTEHHPVGRHAVAPRPSWRRWRSPASPACTCARSARPACSVWSATSSSPPGTWPCSPIEFVATVVFPTLADTAPGYVNDVLIKAAGGTPAGDIGLMQTALSAEGVGYLAGGLLFGIALFRARVLARWAAAPPRHRHARNAGSRRPAGVVQPAARDPDRRGPDRARHLPVARPATPADRHRRPYDGRTRPNRSPLTSGRRYQFTVAGHLDDHWPAWLGDLTITRQDDGTSTLTGTVVDQAELHGVLAGIRDIGATLLSVRALPTEEPPRAG